MTTISVFDAALDACMAYMSDRGAHLFDPPTEECSREEDGYVYLANAANSFGIYEIETGIFTPDESDL
ncbi:hypothetical protein [Alistipes ihumii]|jgi:hypothetical protein|uniref:hypothetical protein n=1 Tax=Alistipes ihumii TaxID=1470347 RepID=UPI003AB405CA